jgi:hypothetical protein
VLVGDFVRDADPRPEESSHDKEYGREEEGVVVAEARDCGRKKKGRKGKKTKMEGMFKTSQYGNVEEKLEVYALAADEANAPEVPATS